MHRRVWDKLARAVTSDAVGLSILGGVALVRAYSYMPGQANPDRSPAHWLEGILPTTAWSWVWIAIGILCVVAIWWRKLIPTAVGAIVGLNLVWAMSFLGVWIIGESSRGYVSALGYIATTALAVWGFGRVQPPREPASNSG